MRSWSLGPLVLAISVLVVPTWAACPNKCSGHGSCGMNDVCDCMQNWTGGDCSGRVCSYARAWQDTAVGDDDAHYYAECANRGVCDRATGLCECDDGFTGNGCRRLGCPMDCSGHGTCEFIEELATNSFDKRIGGQHGRVYSLWDQEKIMGCRCDPGYEGHNCAARVCPKGDDPLTTGQYEMVQAIVVNTESVEGYLTYHDPYGGVWVTDAIAFDTFANAAISCANVQTALRRLPHNVLNTVTVVSASTSYPFARTSPGASDGEIQTAVVVAGTPDMTLCHVRFKSEPGSTGLQNLLECNVQPHAVIGQRPNTVGNAAATCLVHEVYPDATAVAPSASRPLSELAECSGRGLCDSTTGICQCYTGHMGLACERQEALV